MKTIGAILVVALFLCSCAPQEANSAEISLDITVDIIQCGSLEVATNECLNNISSPCCEIPNVQVEINKRSLSSSPESEIVHVKRNSNENN